MASPCNMAWPCNMSGVLGWIFHPLGQGRDVCNKVNDLHRLPSCVLLARACALTCQIAPQKALAPRKALSVNPWSCDERAG